jgi:hypothetical protein
MTNYNPGTDRRFNSSIILPHFFKPDRNYGYFATEEDFTNLGDTHGVTFFNIEQLKADWEVSGESKKRFFIDIIKPKDGLFAS